MTRHRLIELINLVDDFNRKVYANATFSHDRYGDEIHITMHYCREGVCFTTCDGDTRRIIRYNDSDLVKAEAFMKMLMASAEHYEPMKVRDWQK